MGKKVQLFIGLMMCFVVHVQAQTQTQKWRSELYPQGWQPPIEAEFYSDVLRTRSVAAAATGTCTE